MARLHFHQVFCIPKDIGFVIIIVTITNVVVKVIIIVIVNRIFTELEFSSPQKTHLAFPVAGKSFTAYFFSCQKREENRF